MEKRKLSTSDLALMALFVAVIAICSWISIPLGPVPFTLQTLGVMTAAGILGTKRGTLAVLSYILIGTIGVPVFSGFKGGVGVIVGPTGGFIVGFVFTALIVGLITEITKDKKITVKMAGLIISMVIGDIVCFIVGIIWFVIVTKTNVSAALSMCVVPFIIPDIAKIIISTFLVTGIKKRANNILR